MVLHSPNSMCVFASHTPPERFGSAPHHCQFPTDFSPQSVLPLNNHKSKNSAQRDEVMSRERVISLLHNGRGAVGEWVVRMDVGRVQKSAG